MKRIFVSVLTAILIGGTLVSCGEVKQKENANVQEVTNINISDLASKIEQEVGIVKPGEVTKEELKEIYGVNIDNIEEYSMKQAMIMPGIDVLGIFKAKDGKIDELKSDMQKIIDAKTDQAYTPILQEALKEAKVVTHGNYLGIFILQGELDSEGTNSDKAVEIFNSSFK